jgi:hypothetical protein
MKHFEELSRLRVNEAIGAGLEAQRIGRMLADGHAPERGGGWSVFSMLVGLLRWLAGLFAPRRPANRPADPAA